MEYKIPSEYGKIEIDLSMLDKAIKERYPNVTGITLQTIQGKHQTLTIHGAELESDIIKEVLEKHKPRRKMKEKLQGAVALEERVTILEEIILRAGLGDVRE